VPQGTGISGGWRARKGVPSGSRVTQIALVAVGAAALLLGTTRAAAHARRR